MKNYALFLRATKEMSPEAFSDPKEIELRAQWLKDLTAKNIITYQGGTMPPIASMASSINASEKISEGAFIENNHFLTGFLIIEAENLKSAQNIATTNPIIKAGGNVEIREILLR